MLTNETAQEIVDQFWYLPDAQVSGRLGQVIATLNSRVRSASGLKDMLVSAARAADALERIVKALGRRYNDTGREILAVDWDGYEDETSQVVWTTYKGHQVWCDASTCPFFSTMVEAMAILDAHRRFDWE